jgi:lysozyme
MKLNRGEYQGAVDEFPKWKFANKRVLAGLIRRRVAEKSLFLA